MRHSLFSVSGSLAAVLLCAAAPSSRPALAQSAAAAPVSSQAGDAAQTERLIVLRFTKPTEFMARLAPTDRSDKLGVASLVPTGITSLSPDDTRNRLTVKGTPEAIKQIENIARLLDVKPRLVRLQVRILRAPVMTNSAPEAELPESRVVVTAEGSVRNNVPLNLNAVGDGQLFRVFVTPHINGDQTISLSAEFSEVSSIPPISVAAPDGAQTAAIQVKNSRLWTRRIAGGTRTVLASVPNEADRTAAYYLEITPVVQPN